MKKNEVNTKSMSKQPMRGMRDITPKEAYIREQLLTTLKQQYMSSGYNLIETPALENINNLSSNQGGENEKLIFKVMKRGDKLQKALFGNPISINDLSDMGLRYDLTLPLSRYFANNQQQLPLPFKVMQIGDVWRADRPQKNRYRQFKQCDIDIIGNSSITAEIDLLWTTLSFLIVLDLSNLTLKINNRRCLLAVIEWCGFDMVLASQILIELDKIDKIGLDSVCDCLNKMECPTESIEKYRTFITSLSECTTNVDIYNYLLTIFEDNDEITEAINDTFFVLNAIRELFGSKVNISFDVSLVRGMGYYTDTIYEVYCDESYGSAIAGGGRYNNLIGRFTAQDIDAVGISIGFERLINIFMEKSDGTTDKNNERFAVLYDKNISIADFVVLEKEVNEMRTEKKISIGLIRKNRNVKNQIKTLEDMGYIVVSDIEKIAAMVD